MTASCEGHGLLGRGFMTSTFLQVRLALVGGNDFASILDLMGMSLAKARGMGRFVVLAVASLVEWGKVIALFYLPMAKLYRLGPLWERTDTYNSSALNEEAARASTFR